MAKRTGSPATVRGAPNLWASTSHACAAGHARIDDAKVRDDPAGIHRRPIEDIRVILPQRDYMSEEADTPGSGAGTCEVRNDMAGAVEVPCKRHVRRANGQDQVRPECPQVDILHEHKVLAKIIRMVGNVGKLFGGPYLVGGVGLSGPAAVPARLVPDPRSAECLPD